MEPNPAESPGCLVILTALSAAMGQDVRVWLGHGTTEGEPRVCDLPRHLAARLLADELLEALVTTHGAGYNIPLDVAILGYSAGDDGQLRLTSLLPDSNPLPHWMALADLANHPAEARKLSSDPRKWTVSRPCEGTAPAAAALAEVYRLIALWLTGRFIARPPVVVHCTAGEQLDDEYFHVARSLGVLATAYGPARLLHVGFVSGFDPAVGGSWLDPLSGPWAALQEVSAVLSARGAAGTLGRPAVFINDWSLVDFWDALFDLIPVEDQAEWTVPEAVRFEPKTFRTFWTAKLGNTPEQWEDAAAAEPVTGLAAVADGASSGIYCRLWADLLTRCFVTDRPDLRDAAVLSRWVNGLRTEWRKAINYPALTWSQQRKVGEVGAAATFLGLEVGPVDGAGHRPWRAVAVGDACLFWVRKNRLLVSFPVVASDQFGSAPLLVRSLPGYPTSILTAAGWCRPDDLFLLATDALAAHLLDRCAAGSAPDWDRFETIAENDWQAELDALRRERHMVNDDCTLMVLRVAGIASRIPSSVQCISNTGPDLCVPSSPTLRSEGEPLITEGPPAETASAPVIENARAGTAKIPPSDPSSLPPPPEAVPPVEVRGPTEPPAQDGFSNPMGR